VPMRIALSPDPAFKRCLVYADGGTELYGFDLWFTRQDCVTFFLPSESIRCISRTVIQESSGVACAIVVHLLSAAVVFTEE